MKRKIHLPIIIEQDEDKVYIVSCPTFRGCHTQGKTINEALKRIEKVIEMYLEDVPFSNSNEFVGLREMEFELN